MKLERIQDCYCLKCGRLGHARKDCSYPLAVSLKDPEEHRYKRGLGVRRARNLNVKEDEEIDENTEANCQAEDMQQAIGVQSEAQDSRTQRSVEVQVNQGEDDRQQRNESEENLNYEQEVQRFRARMARIRRRFALNVTQENERSFSVEQEIMEIENQMNQSNEVARNQMTEQGSNNQERGGAEAIQAIYRSGIQGEHEHGYQQAIAVQGKDKEIVIQEGQNTRPRKKKCNTPSFCYSRF
ncbi:hypothetical protein PIB30_046995 [Stylosanthes scabra]|uniref:CCHC-type domain-containing protein n=1 Tax=Stylosanthes scabra TaxID=79078 RepID=A0ABU6XGV8_9FABA|nr:hypothetical protein [Stylosanthes scabra]